MAWNLILPLKVRSHKTSEVEGRVVTCRPQTMGTRSKERTLQGTMVSHSSLAKAIQNCPWLEMRPKELPHACVQSLFGPKFKDMRGNDKDRKNEKNMTDSSAEVKRLFSSFASWCHSVLQKIPDQPGPLPSFACNPFWGLPTWHVLYPILLLGLQKPKSCDDNLRTSCSIPRAVRYVCVGVFSSE